MWNEVNAKKEQKTKHNKEKKKEGKKEWKKDRKGNPPPFSFEKCDSSCFFSGGLQIEYLISLFVAN